jgi:hypothetical protein
MASGHIELDGKGTLVWDGRDGKGKRVAAGCYHLVVEFDGGITILPVILLP